MARDEALFGKKDPSALFGDAPATLPPWPPAGRRKDVQDYDQDAVNQAVREGKTEPVDPRGLRSTQDFVTHAGVQHYMHSTEVYKDQHQAGNKNPVIYERNGSRIILSGHHRATAALLRGEQFDAVVAKGGWGPPR